MKKFSERIRELRTKYKLTQKDVATNLGLTYSAYGYYEQGRYEPSLETIIKLTQIYDVSISCLLVEVEQENKCINKTIDPETKEFIQDILDAPKEEREELIRFWKFAKQKR